MRFAKLHMPDGVFFTLEKLSLLLLLGGLIFSTTAFPVRADLASASRSIVPSARLVGSGMMTLLGFRIFKAELYAPNGQFQTNKPFALKLTYQRKFTAKAIADKSVEEMRRQGYRDSSRLARWKREMIAIFPNVTKGQSITGLRTKTGHAVFYSGNKRLGEIRDPEFTRRFFAIWLGSNTSDPALRNRLVGSGS